MNTYVPKRLESPPSFHIRDIHYSDSSFLLTSWHTLTHKILSCKLYRHFLLITHCPSQVFSRQVWPSHTKRTLCSLFIQHRFSGCPSISPLINLLQFHVVCRCSLGSVNKMYYFELQEKVTQLSGKSFFN